MRKSRTPNKSLHLVTSMPMKAKYPETWAEDSANRRHSVTFVIEDSVMDFWTLGRVDRDLFDTLCHVDVTLGERRAIHEYCSRAHPRSMDCCFIRHHLICQQFELEGVILGRPWTVGD